MSKHQAGKHLKQGSSRAATSQKPKSRRKFIGVLLGVLIIAVIGVVAYGFLTAGPKYNTLEEIYNDYRDTPESKKFESSFSFIKIKARSNGIDDVALTVQGNELIGTFLIPSESSPVFRHALQLRLQDEDIRNDAMSAISTLEADLANEGITLNGDVTICYVCRDAAGQEVGQAVYNRDGLASYEGPDITITLEDLYNDELAAESRASIEEEIRTTAESLAEAIPGSNIWMEVHGNEIEAIFQLNVQGDEIDPSALDEIFRDEELVSGIASDAINAEDALREYSVEPLNVHYRYTIRDAEGNVLATYLFNKDGIVEE